MYSFFFKIEKPKESIKFEPCAIEPVVHAYKTITTGKKVEGITKETLSNVRIDKIFGCLFFN